ncbi:MAG TPA: SDR family oxidoreductase [Verrucomicrobiae bacterium]|nr:SDR family oxidoreductase [Verrucomicrobiae bacterium]
MKDLFSMQGKRVLVTGGTRGIGRAITLQFARAGARVLANFVRDQEAATRLEDSAQAEGLAVKTLRADLTSAKGMDTVATAVDADFGTLSGLVHCAATGVHRPFEQLTLRHFDWTLNLNVRAFFELVHRLLPKFESGSSILSVSSEGAVRAVPQYTLIGTSKGALEAMSRHLAAELAPRGIRVNILAPGTVVTDAWQVLPDREARLAEAAKRSALKRLCTLEEVAQAAQFLCSEAASGIVGQTLIVDGGAAVSG